jgi:hypothetical protein
MAMKRGEESTRCQASAGEMETVGQRIDSASPERGRVATGGLGHGRTLEGWRQRLECLEKGDRGRWAGWAEQPGDLGRLQREWAWATRRNGPKSTMGCRKPFQI